MSSPHAELRRLVQRLRTELEWASRTGLEATFEVPKVEASALEPEAPVPVVPVEAGRPAPPEPERANAASPTEEEPPPAFEPDPEEPPVPVEVHGVPPSRVRRPGAPGARPWERYLDDEVSDASPPVSPRTTDGGAVPSKGAERGATSARPGFPGSGRPPPRDPEPLPEPRGATPPNRGLAGPSSSAEGPALARATSLGQVREVLGDCTRCKLHRAGRKQIVFGVGNPQAELMFVGEGPGRQEDLRGEPFVGEAGQLLTRIIENGMKVRRADVYIANIVKCRPPGNRDPEPDEVEACEPFLRAQIAVIKPRVIVALGKYAAQTLLRTSIPIRRLRGTWRTYQGIDLMPTYHPAYLLRNPSEKRPVWEDMQAVMSKLGWGR